MGQKRGRETQGRGRVISDAVSGNIRTGTVEAEMGKSMEIGIWNTRSLTHRQIWLYYVEYHVYHDISSSLRPVHAHRALTRSDHF